MLRKLLAFIKMSTEDQVLDEEAAKTLGTKIGIDWETSKFPVSQFQDGIKVELEHGSRDPETNVTSNDMESTGRIAWAHLKEIPDYYTRLAAMEKKGDEGESGPPVPKENVAIWLREHPDPDDSEVHAFAENNGWNVHMVEEVIYQLATEAAQKQP